MRTLRTDVAILGAGTAGLNASREVKRAGKEWLLIDPGPYGTTCARVGCMPSKLLIAAADAAHHARHTELFGVHVDEVRIDGHAVMARIRAERDRFVGFVLEDMEKLPQEQLIRGRARFVGPGSLRVDDHTHVEANAFVITTGSSPWIPPQLEGVDGVMINDDVFELEDLPRSLAIFGTGVIGLEIGQALSRLGVEVAFFNPFDELGGFTDPVVSAKAHEVLGQRLDLNLGIADLHVTREGDGGEYRIGWSDGEGMSHSRHFERVLAAAGRRPNLKGLGLDTTDVPFDAKGRPVVNLRTMQCGEAPIFIAGDANAFRPVLHEAADEGRVAGANAARLPEVEGAMRKANLQIAFTEPQMAIVGESWAHVDHDQVAVGTVSFDNQGRSRVMGLNVGVGRLYADLFTCRLLGAELFGPRIEHLAHLLAWAVQDQKRIPDLLRMPIYHPVIEEGLKTAFRDLSRELRIAGHCPPEDRGEGPGG